jgi:hypothetical protein
VCKWFKAGGINDIELPLQRIWGNLLASWIDMQIVIRSVPAPVWLYRRT